MMIKYKRFRYEEQEFRWALFKNPGWEKHQPYLTVLEEYSKEKKFAGTYKTHWGLAILSNVWFQDHPLFMELRDLNLRARIDNDVIGCMLIYKKGLEIINESLQPIEQLKVE